MRTYAILAAWIFACLGLVWTSPAMAQERDSIPAEELEELLDELDEELDDMRDEFDRRLERLRERYGDRLRELLGRPARPEEPRGTGEAWLGISLAEVDEETRTLLDIPADRGVLVAEIAEGSPAAAALQTFDIILALDGEPVREPATVAEAVQAGNPGDVVRMEILREGESREVRVTLGERGATPEHQPQPAPPGSLREFLDRAFEEGDRPDPEAPAPGLGGDMFEGLDDLFDGDGLGDLLERFMDPDGEGGGFGELLDELFNGDGEGGGLGDLLDDLFNGDGEGGGLGDLLERFSPDSERDDQDGERRDPLQDLFERFMPPQEREPEVGPRPWLGFQGRNVPAEMQRREGVRGVIIENVVADGPAAEAGLQQGDILTELGGHEINNLDDVRTALLDLEPGDEAGATVLRDGEPVELTVLVGERPE